MSLTPPTLVLFDIDGTLILSGRAGLRGLNRAIEQIYGAGGALDRIPIAGRTDRAIVHDVLESLGVAATPSAFEAIRTAYLEHLAREIVKPADSPSGILPGVERLLEALAPRSDVRLGLLTGNFEHGARIKLSHFALWDRFSFGAFGDDHVDRRALVPIALDRSSAAGHIRPPMDQVVIIGDTPLDVDCAHAHGARAIAVATGPFSVEVLQDAGADLVVGSLESIDAVLDCLTVRTGA